jgi:outer membrane protein TolC
MGQQLTIDECQSKAEANYPLIKQYALIEQARDYNASAAAKAYLPQVSISAKATYQTDVTKLPLDLNAIGQMFGVSLNIPEVSKDQYAASIDITQTIWDGGITAAKRAGINAQSDAAGRELDVSLYAIRDKVNDLYFGILTCDAMREQNRLYQDELQRSHDRVSAAVRNGLAAQSDLDAVRVEQLKAEQSLAQISNERASYLRMLAIFIGEELGDDTLLQPVPTVESSGRPGLRPEMAMFDARLRETDARHKAINAAWMPRIGLFISGGYGRPGLNMLEDKFKTYAVGGVRLSWNFGALYTRRSDLRTLDVNRSGIEVQREAFEFNNRLNLSREDAAIAKYRDLLRKDDDIISLRESIRAAAESKFDNGTYTVTDLLREVTAEQMSKIDKALHEIALQQAIYKRKFLNND